MSGIEGTITLKKPLVSQEDIPSFTKESKQESAASLPAVKKAPVKNNVVAVTVHLDGSSHAFMFSVPLSSSLLSGQKTNASLRATFEKMLAKEFGRVALL